MRAWIRLSLGALSWCQLDLQLLVVLCAHAHWACLDVGDAHGGGDRARREARQRFSRLGAPGHAAAVVGAPRRVLDDPDAFGGLLGALARFAPTFEASGGVLVLYRALVGVVELVPFFELHNQFRNGWSWSIFFLFLPSWIVHDTRTSSIVATS